MRGSASARYTRPASSGPGSLAARPPGHCPAGGRHHQHLPVIPPGQPSDHGHGQARVKQVGSSRTITTGTSTDSAATARAARATAPASPAGLSSHTRPPHRTAATTLSATPQRPAPAEPASHVKTQPGHASRHSVVHVAAPQLATAARPPPALLQRRRLHRPVTRHVPVNPRHSATARPRHQPVRNRASTADRPHPSAPPPAPPRPDPACRNVLAPLFQLLKVCRLRCDITPKRTVLTTMPDRARSDHRAAQQAAAARHGGSQCDACD